MRNKVKPYKPAKTINKKRISKLAWMLIALSAVIAFAAVNVAMATTDYRQPAGINYTRPVKTVVLLPQTEWELKSAVYELTDSVGWPREEVNQIIMCESGWRTQAINKANSNGTWDVGLFQINDVHGLTVDERLDWKTNTLKAIELYARQGNSPWVCARILGIA